MTGSQPLQELLELCRTLGADVRYEPEYAYLTALAWEDDGEQHARSIQRQIQQQAEKYPGLVCYCFDLFSTLVYAI